MKKTLINVKVEIDMICFLDEVGTKSIHTKAIQIKPKKHKRFNPLVLITSMDDKGCSFLVEYNKTKRS